VADLANHVRVMGWTRQTLRCIVKTVTTHAMSRPGMWTRLVIQAVQDTLAARHSGEHCRSLGCRLGFANAEIGWTSLTWPTSGCSPAWPAPMGCARRIAFLPRGAMPTPPSIGGRGRTVRGLFPQNCDAATAT